MVFEIVLRYPDRERVVFSETPLEPGMTVELAGRTWMVLEAVRPRWGGGRVRFLCEPQDDARAPAGTTPD
jgi:hypothetical protein